MSAYLKRFLEIFLISFLLFSCAHVEKEKSPEEIYREGEHLYHKKRYAKAIEVLKPLPENYPQDPYAIKAELLIADVYYESGKYGEALSHYEDFFELHPTHPKTPYVLYRIGMCYYKRVLGADRDQTFTKEAISRFQYLISNHPESRYAKKAKKKIRILENKLSKNRFLIGKFYLKKGKYEAAIERLKEALDKVSDRKLKNKILLYLVFAYKKAGREDKAKDIYSKLKKFSPKSKCTKKAKDILDGKLSFFDRFKLIYF